MRRRIRFAAAAAVISLLAAVSAYPAAAMATEIPEERQLPLVVDAADLLTDDEESSLETKLETISEERECEVALVTCYGTGGKSIEAYADDFYDYNGYGYGDDDNGIMLVVDMDGREWALTTYGYAIDAFTDERQDAMSEYFLSYLSSGDYYTAFLRYADACDSILYSARNGEYDTPTYYMRDDETGETSEITYEEAHGVSAGSRLARHLASVAPICVIVSLIVAAIVVAALSSGMKSIKSQSAAANYIRNGSMKVTRQRDVFLYRNVSRTPRSTESSGSRAGGGGGHSTVHHSSSGHVHGGSHGRF